MFLWRGCRSADRGEPKRTVTKDRPEADALEETVALKPRPPSVIERRWNPSPTRARRCSQSLWLSGSTAKSAIGIDRHLSHLQVDEYSRAVTRSVFRFRNRAFTRIASPKAYDVVD